MDSDAFDRLVRGFSESTSRRRALGGLLGGALVGVGGVGASEAKQRHRRHGRARDAAKGGNSDCAHFCVSVFSPGPDRGHCVSAAAHDEGLCRQCNGDANAVCCTRRADDTCDPSQSLVCSCPAGQTCCSGQCVDLSQDADHCGQCDVACPPFDPTIPVIPACCGGRCVDLRSDSNNCGTCGQRCMGGTICERATCAHPA
jgi:Stigma-specific protein, Stig1